MKLESGRREAYFPAIEKKHHEPITFWLSLISEMASDKYPDQIANLRENYGFSQAHANALVMFSRGSESSKRFDTPDDYFKALGKVQAKTVKAIFAVIRGKYPELELVIAWNQPMLKSNGKYVLGVCAVSDHILIAPWSKAVLEKFAGKMKELDVKKKTIGVPNDWQLDEKLLLSITKARLIELKPTPSS